MPTYEYACPKCASEFELFQSMNDAPLKKCPKCKKTGVRRLVGGGAGLIFKGSGFYITDYKNKPDAAKAEGSKTDGAKSVTGGAEKSAPAPAKTEAKPVAAAAK